jgi:tRNA-specific 2-thiouridylase
MERIMIAMSGGVDSTAAALLLKERGYECAGGTMDLGLGLAGKARETAERLGLPFHSFDCAEEFQTHVIGPYKDAYRAGRTPNPCVVCNRVMKFGVFLRHAQALGYDKIATGHYARVENTDGRYLLKKGLDAQKDQSYFLYALTQEQLARVMFPLGGMTKGDVRGLCGGFDTGGESQDVCFSVDHSSPPGRFIDTEGRDLGEHKGIIHYTVGQRRGLGVSHSRPLYVTEIRASANTVVLGPEASLYRKKLTVRECSLITELPSRASVKIRYRHAEQPAAVTRLDEDTLQIEFDEPVRAAAPGQSAVIYDGGIVIGGGIII